MKMHAPAPAPRRSFGRLTRCLTVALALTGLLSSCAKAPAPTELAQRVFVLGVDGLSADLVDTYVAEGKLPHFAQLDREGARATLIAPDPLDPTQLWTTALTGKSPAHHQVVGEYVQLPQSGQFARTPSSARRTKNLVQIIGEQGSSVLSVGMPASWPAEVVNGIVVANGYREHRWTEASEHDFDLAAAGMLTYPKSVGDEIADLVHGVGELPREDVSRFFVFDEREYRMLYDGRLGSLRRHDNPPRDFGLTLQADRSNLAIAERLSQRYRSRFVLTDLELPAAVSPTFWYFSEPDVYQTPLDSQRRLGHAVPEVYRWVDERVGELLDRMGPADALLVVAPMGYEDGDRTNEEGQHVTVPVFSSKGHLWFYGRGAARGVRGHGGNLEDLAPTVLALFDLDVGEDMDGKVLRDLFDPAYLAAHPVTATESYDRDWDLTTRYPKIDLPDSSAHAEEQP